MTSNDKVIARNEIEKLLTEEKSILITLFKRQLAKYLLQLLQKLAPRFIDRIFGDGTYGTISRED